MSGIRPLTLGCAFGMTALGFAPSADAGTRIEGRLVGHDGEPVSPSHVQVVRMSSDDEVALVEVGDDGRYSLDVDADGIAVVRFAAHGHEPADLPLHLDGGTVEVDARLATYRYHDTFENVTVRGDMNNWRFQRAPRLRKDFDGQWFGQYKSRDETLAYQLMGIVPGRSVAGTDAQSLEYDGHGDYRASVGTLDGQAIITFDPERLVSSPRELSIEIDGEHRVWLEVMDIARDMERRTDAYQAILSRSRREKSDPGPPLTALRDELPDIRKALAEADGPVLESARLVEAIQLDRMSRTGGGADSSLVERAMNELAADSPYWSLAPEVIGYVVKHSGGYGEHKPWLDEMIDRHPDPDVCRNALVRGVNYAEQSGQDAVRDEYYKILRDRYPGSDELEYVTQRVLRGKMVAGKQAPAFTVASLDDPDQSITLDSLKGKTVLIDFWATWCKPCVAEMGSIHKLYEEFGGDDFEIVSFSFDRRADAIPAFRADKWPMPWLHTFVEDGFKSPIAESFGVTSLPKPILIDPDGTVLAVGRDLRGDRLRPAVAAALELRK